MIMLDSPTKLARCQCGAAGAEMALIIPLLSILMFGSFELGNYFYSQHVVTKSVRDGARFASRAFPIDVNCATLPSGVVGVTRTLTRTGQVSGGSARLAGWTDDLSVSVVPVPNTDVILVGSGIYKGRPTNICTIRVTARVKYVPILKTLGLANTGVLFLNASSDAPVVGI